jgi:hypothetical protein
VSWTTELAAAESAEQTYRNTRKGSLPGYWRFDGRGAALISDWIAQRSSASSAFSKPSIGAWLNVAARAVSNMGASWSVVTALPAAPTTWQSSFVNENSQPFGSLGAIDGLFDGLMSNWANAVWTQQGGALPCAGFPPQEFWANLLGRVLESAGPT